MLLASDQVARDDVYETFLRRANRYFPEESVRSWSRVDRLIFNHLMGKLIHCYGYAAISDAMLQQCSVDMNEAVRRFAGG
jgi:hypothetical protein